MAQPRERVLSLLRVFPMLLFLALLVVCVLSGVFCLLVLMSWLNDSPESQNSVS